LGTMAEYRTLHTKIWQDEWFCEQEPDAKLLFIYLVTNRAAALAGIYKLPYKFIAFETGIPIKRIMSLLNEFGKGGKVYHQDGIIWVKKLRTYQTYTGKASPQVQSRIDKDIAEIPECDLKTQYREYQSTGEYPTDTVSIPYRETETDTETDTETETDTKTETPPAAKKPPRVRSPDLLFDAISEVCQADPATAGPQIGKVKAALLKADPPYTPEEVRQFGVDWWAWADRSAPPTVWALKERIGSVRGGRPSDNGAKPNEPKGYAGIREYVRKRGLDVGGKSGD